MQRKQPKDPLPADHEARMARARLSLEGLSVGDAFGERFFGMNADRLIASRRLPDSPWYWTDDTAMGLSIYQTLDELGGIDCDALAERFARKYAEEPHVGSIVALSVRLDGIPREWLAAREPLPLKGGV